MKLVVFGLLLAAAPFANGASPVFITDQFVLSSPVTPSTGASVDVDGEIMVVGAPHANQFGASATSDVGAVFVYERSSSGWTLVQTLQSPQPETGAEFGASVAVEDGLLLIGEPGRSGDTGEVHLLIDSPTDAVTAFGYADSGPSMVGNPSTVGARFGESLALIDRNLGNANSYWVAIGQPDFVPRDHRRGRVLIYSVAHSFSNATVASVSFREDIPAKGYREEGFGRSVAIERAGCVVSECERYYLAAGAPESDFFFEDDPDDVIVEDRGLVRVFTFEPLDPGDTDVVEFGENQGFDRRYLIEGELDYEYLGTSLALTNANLVQPALAVGSPYKDNGQIESAGRIGFYELQSDSSWSLKRQFVSFQDRARLGAAISASISTIWFSVPYADSNGLVDTGQVYQATRSAGAGGDWDLDVALENAEPYEEGLLGISLAADGTNVVAGIPGAFSANVWRRGWLLTTSVNQQGATVAGAQGRISCPSASGCSTRIAHGDQVTLLATGGTHAIFDHWGPGPCAAITSNACVLTLGADAAAAAVFTQARKISVSMSGSNQLLTAGDVEIFQSGSVVKACVFTCSEKVPVNRSVRLTASDTSSLKFLGWGGACAGTSTNVCWLAASESDVAVVANYGAEAEDDTLFKDGFEGD